jgi:hypothetical protein
MEVGDINLKDKVVAVTGGGSGVNIYAFYMPFMR